MSLTWKTPARASSMQVRALSRKYSRVRCLSSFVMLPTTTDTTPENLRVRGLEILTGFPSEARVGLGVLFVVLPAEHGFLPAVLVACPDAESEGVLGRAHHREERIPF